MTRLEENGMVVDEMTKRAERNPIGTYEEMVTFQLGVIATMLADISKSLAIIADKTESEIRDDKEKTIKIIDKTIKDFLECEGGESWLRIDGEEYTTDVGYALEGMEIFAKVLKKRLVESEDKNDCKHMRNTTQSNRVRGQL